MSLKIWAFLYLSPGFSPEIHTTEVTSDSTRFISVGIDVFQKELCIDLAKDLVKKGVQAIELCGGFGPAWVTKISEAINYAIPVGGVMYGPEFRKPLVDLMVFKK